MNFSSNPFSKLFQDNPDKPWTGRVCYEAEWCYYPEESFMVIFFLYCYKHFLRIEHNLINIMIQLFVTLVTHEA